MSVPGNLAALRIAVATNASYEAGMRAARDRADAIEAENRKLRDELVGLRESWYTRYLAAADRATKAEEGLREAVEALGAAQEELRLIDMKDRALYNPALRPQIALTVARIKGLLPP